jgi:hypothetical protein
MGLDANAVVLLASAVSAARSKDTKAADKLVKEASVLAKMDLGTFKTQKWMPYKKQFGL